jgi:hypothetical protein
MLVECDGEREQLRLRTLHGCSLRPWWRSVVLVAQVAEDAPRSTQLRRPRVAV